MTYSLRRTHDGAGDAGPMCDLFFPTFDQDTGKVLSVETKHNARPEVGSSVRVGSPYGRTYAGQDWWQTTLVTEILEHKINEDDTEYMQFKTGNSEYEWEIF